MATGRKFSLGGKGQEDVIALLEPDSKHSGTVAPAEAGSATDATRAIATEIDCVFNG